MLGTYFNMSFISFQVLLYLSDHCIVIYNIFLIVITMLQAKFYHCFVTDEIEAWESLVN